MFDGKKTAPYVETDPVAPLSVYERTELAGEQAVINSRGMFVIMRTSLIISPYGRNFVKTMLRLAQKR
ncbi:MAG TPA: dTDP-4-dehydrorhamnose reductase [Hyphomicrobiaceae bacterium MAG_BT-2024]